MCDTHSPSCSVSASHVASCAVLLMFLNWQAARVSAPVLQPRPARLRGPHAGDTLIRRFRLMVANAQHFFQCSHALKCFDDTVIQQSTHTVNARLTADCLGGFTIECHLPNSSVEPHHFKNAK